MKKNNQTMESSLRDWLQKSEASGELKRVEGADWDLEIGALTALNAKRRDCPALLFDNIKGYPPGHRVLTCSTSSRGQLSRTFNVPPCDSDMDLVKVFSERLPKWEAAKEEFPPEIVESGPVLENVQSGDDVNLFKFPAPKWHELDKNRYIGTGDAVITKDPDTGLVNLGTYRIMVHDEKTVALFITPSKHGRLHYNKYHERGERCPVAISIGHHPLIFRVACTRVSDSEYNFIGSIKGEPVKVIREEITDLLIPYDSEIVLVGWCPPDDKRKEGPFGEWTGYYAGREEELSPIVEVERIYHRNDPIILGSPPDRPPHDSSYFRSILGSALLYNELQKNGIPDVKGVWLSDAGLDLFIIISLKQRYPGHARQAALFAIQNRIAASLGRFVVVVDEDVDPTNINDVLWALCTRCDPEKDIDIMRRLPSSSLDPIIRRPAQAFFTSKAIFDACKPYEWKEEYPLEINMSPELVDRVKNKWGKLLNLEGF